MRALTVDPEHISAILYIRQRQEIAALLIRAAIIGNAQSGHAQADFPARQFVGMRLTREQTGGQKDEVEYLSHRHS